MKYSTHPHRYLCLWFPEWPLQRFLAARAEHRRKAVLLTERTSRGDFVRYANGISRKLGIRDGMPLAEARSFSQSRRLVSELMAPQHDREALIQIALRCERYSFCIGLEDAVRPECVLMD